MLLNRLDKQGQRDHPGLAEAPSVTARGIYYDTVCYGSKAAFMCAYEAFGAGHLVTGSDYPVLQDYEAYKETFAYISRLVRLAGLLDRCLVERDDRLDRHPSRLHRHAGPSNTERP